MISTLGLRLKLAREKAGLSQRQLAERIGTGGSQQAINKIENGGTVMPRKELLDSLCTELKIEPSWLLTGLDGLERVDQESLNLLLKWLELPNDENKPLKS